ncbi:MAG: enoyl-CoA hydratase/isomerase family protein [Acidimicrobiia bacterium]|nr:enoyl-CoA hydratase/isomerase family protein [Acidimicrobiia bacterium]
MEYQNLDFWTDADVGYVALDRPNHRNALSFDLLEELVAVAREISSSDLRTVVVTGNGTDFCAGFDVSGFEVGLLQESTPVQRYEAAQLGGVMADAIESLPQITVAALHGNVIGGGVVLTAACDLRVADADTVFSIPEVDLGIPLAWGGIERLVREFGSAITKELVLTCRPFTAQEGKAAGFLNAITQPGGSMDIAKELAVHIAERPRLPTVTTKRHVAEVLRGDFSRDDAMGLITALDDDESTAARNAYLARFRTTT